MKWKVVKCAALTLLKVREETWINSEICFQMFFFFLALKIYFSLSVLGDWNGLGEGTSICYGTAGPSHITPINLNGSHKAHPPHLDGNIPLLIRDQLHSGLPGFSGYSNVELSVITL